MIFVDKRRSGKPIKVVKIKDLGTTCPTQFEGTTDDGKYIYIRYRWDKLTVRLANSEEECFKSDNSKILSVLFVTGDDWCGEISYDTVREILMEKEIYLPVNCDPMDTDKNIEEVKALAEKAKELLEQEFECNREELKQLNGAIVGSIFASDRQVKIFLITQGGVKKLVVKGGTYVVSKIEEVE